ncbi:phytoene/squalene synthase family protein [Aureimonas psammosilenae]|uniref:phytoene/squalene synthase family protein n=1 Tax=Aureimonas psammosilenae TaxID=2495496 RepID=UPI0012613916|nr:phytoene/squalene synthase family protein [Aureimonas psammosilenae]
MSDAATIARLSEEIIAKGSQSFAAAARLFDPATRTDAMMLYAWCRHCDDVVDGQELGSGGTLLATDARERLGELERDTRRAFAGEAVAHPAFQALQLVAKRHAMPEALALDHLEGFRMDVEERHYESVEDLLDYCHHVAGVVGVMMARIMGARDAATLQRAADLGLAFQLTNIARDIVPDARVGRIYLPAQWLREIGLDLSRITEEAEREKVARLARRLVDLAEPYYASAHIGIEALPRRSAWAIATALGVYRRIGVEVVRRGSHAWDKRVSTGKAAKLGEVAKGGLIALMPRARSRAPRSAELWAHSA